jgi:CheY-like chemotaxis protein
MTELTPRDDIRKSVSEILRRVDQLIRVGSYDHAQKEIARAKELEPRNVYIQAYEERISSLVAEQELKARQEARETPPSAGEGVASTGESVEMLADKTDAERRRFEEEEKRTEDALRKAAELKRRAEEEVRKRRSGPSAPETGSPKDLPSASEPSQTSSADRQRNMGVFLQRLKEEELRRRKIKGGPRLRLEPEEEGDVDVTPSGKYRRAVMSALSDGQLSTREKEIIAKLRSELTLSDDQATKLEDEARRDLYVRSFKDAWFSGRISPDNTSFLADLQRRYNISADDHAALEAKILAAIGSVERKPRVMVVDDDEKLLMLLADSLTEAGFEPIALATSDEAFRLIRESPPDLIVSDINLETSTMGGFTFYEKVREIEELADIPFIFLSGLTDEVLIRTGKELGVDDYITKPFSEEVLIATIRGKLRRFAQLKRKKR